MMDVRDEFLVVEMDSSGYPDGLKECERMPASCLHSHAAPPCSEKGCQGPHPKWSGCLTPVLKGTEPCLLHLSSCCKWFVSIMQDGDREPKVMESW